MFYLNFSNYLKSLKMFLLNLFLSLKKIYVSVGSYISNLLVSNTIQTQLLKGQLYLYMWH